jgi:DNA-binding protein Fis
LSIGRNLSAGDQSLINRIKVAMNKPFPEAGIDFEDIVDHLQAELISKAMRETGSNQSKAAELLNLNRDKLRYRLKNLNFEEE